MNCEQRHLFSFGETQIGRNSFGNHGLLAGPFGGKMNFVDFVHFQVRWDLAFAAKHFAWGGSPAIDKSAHDHIDGTLGNGNFRQPLSGFIFPRQDFYQSSPEFVFPDGELKKFFLQQIFVVDKEMNIDEAAGKIR